MTREIGGYIEFEYNHGSMLHEDAIHLNCGRRAFSYLIKSKGIKKVWIPRFSCSSVREPFEKAGCQINYYSVKCNFLPVLDEVPEDEYIILINYYGQVNNEIIREIAEKYSNLIVDNTQAYFQMPINGIDTVYTCRKYFGVTDGALLYTDSILKENLAVDESFERMRYILGRFERTASEFYGLYDKNNCMFDNEPIKQMSKLTENLLHGIDYELVKKQREKNFEFLHERLSNLNKLSLNVPRGAFMYPLFIDNGEAVRKKLQARKIYIPTLWADVFNVCKVSDVEYQMAKYILPLPVDQRYGFGDMEYIATEVFNCIGS